MSNRVRGPSSALSSFLRERGIVAPRRVVRPVEPDQAPDAAAEPTAIQSGSEPSDTTNTESNPQAVALETSTDQSAPSTVTIQVNPTPLLSTASKKKASAAKKRKRGKADDSNDEADETFYASSRSAHSKRRSEPIAAPYNMDQKPTPEILFCTRCQRRYLPSLNVTKKEQGLCDACIGLHVQSGKRMSKIQIKKKKLESLSIGGEAQTIMLSLRDMCIKLIANLIEDVEQLGDIPYSTKCKISKIISKQRQLTNHTVQLFLGPEEDIVELFDCTRLDENGLQSIAYLCPNVKTLNLSVCGRITNKVLEEIGASCNQLSSLVLKGCFIPSDFGFSSLFSGLGSTLQELTLENAAKLTNLSLITLLESATHLRLLSLTACVRLGNDAISTISKMKCLEHLELNNLSEGVSPECISELICTIGSQLRILALNGHDLLDDNVVAFISETCKCLESLSLSDCPSITSKGMVHALTHLSTESSTGLVHLNFNRNVLFNDDVVFALVNQAANTLKHLGMNGLDELTEKAMQAVADNCTQLVDLDVSWIRCMSDTIFEKIMKNATHLQRIKIYGCHDLTLPTLNHVWRNKEGRAIEIQGNEFD
ncbi:hypothetical protein BDEG_24146 [Batrachochytrium dendrobatidis JEL423]|uniref:F-box/LRR-repeat protein 15-like leucin rich repeat domain-containing protein n=1 Tax=Batrachochytrium dendrobatidis (strain JEL423) TaxID=403673 RepID=A0A177WKQ9_BATDL|nr:hypothetical protein BDEG_24146 [Batrachochytrium dendrobatidis JEL423]